MVLQSTHSVQMILPQAKDGNTPKAVSSAETGFKDLLDGALQSKAKPPKARENQNEHVKQYKDEKKAHSDADKADDQPVKKVKNSKQTQDIQSEETQAQTPAELLTPMLLPEIKPADELLKVQLSIPAAEHLQVIGEKPIILIEPMLQMPQEFKQSPSQLQDTVLPLEQPKVHIETTAKTDDAQSQSRQTIEENAAKALNAADFKENRQTEVKVHGSLETLIAKASEELPAKTIQIDRKVKNEIPLLESEREVSALVKMQQSKETDKPKFKEKQTEFSELPVVQIRGMQAEEVLKPAAKLTTSEQVQTKIAEHLEQGKTEFRMQLAPKELGKVDVRMLLDENKLTVQIITATSKAAQELQRSGESLIASLRMAGAQLETVQIVHRSQEFAQQSGEAFNMENEQRQNSGDSHGQGTRQQGQGAEWEEDTYRAPETPSRLLDQAV